MRRLMIVIGLLGFAALAQAAEMKLTIITEGKVCDGYDATCLADGVRLTFHFGAKPKDTILAVTPLATAHLSRLAAEASPEGAKAAKVAEAVAAGEMARAAAAVIAAVKLLYPAEKLPTVIVTAAAAEASK